MNGNNTSNACGSLTAFALGALVGGGIALLWAPHSGKETRDMLAQRSHEMKEKAESAVGRAREAVHEKKNQLAAAVDAGIEAVRSHREHGGESANG
jgi:gas vesicle protein